MTNYGFKSQILNPKQIQSTKFRIQKDFILNLDIGILDLFRI